MGLPTTVAIDKMSDAVAGPTPRSEVVNVSRLSFGNDSSGFLIGSETGIEAKASDVAFVIVLGWLAFIIPISIGRERPWELIYDY
jgi:hypothetical protein